MDDSLFESIIKILEKTPPQYVEKSLENLACLFPRYSEDIFKCVEQIPTVLVDSIVSKRFLCCSYNNCEHGYRSPWSNYYFSASVESKDNTLQSQEEKENKGNSLKPHNEFTKADLFFNKSVSSNPMRQLEKDFNHIFQAYCDAYTAGGISSVYVWPSERNGFQAAFLLYNEVIDPETNFSILWSSTHLVEATLSNRLGAYIFSSTCIFRVSSPEHEDKQSLGVRVSETKKLQHPLLGVHLLDSSNHISVIGPKIELLEHNLRRRIEDTFITKLESIMTTLRNTDAADSHRTDSATPLMRKCICELTDHLRNHSNLE